jgi:glucose dehydrogenase
MESFFEWLQSQSVPTWVSESDSIWGFPTVLFLHSVGMGLSAGAAFIIGLRLLGVGRPLPVSSLRVLFKIFWGGFVLNFVTGSLLFAAHATTTGYVPMYYAKLVLILVGVILLFPMRRFVDSDASDGVIPAHLRALALASLGVWIGVITTGRLIAYFS